MSSDIMQAKGLNVKSLIISLTNAVNLTAIGLIVSKNQSLLVRKILKEKVFYALFHM